MRTIFGMTFFFITSEKEGFSTHARSQDMGKDMCNKRARYPLLKMLAIVPIFT